MATEAPPALAPSRLRWVKRGFIGLGLILLVALAWMWIVNQRTASRGRHGLKAALAEAEAEHPRWRWDDLEDDRPILANLDNSVRRIREAIVAEVKWDEKDLQRADGKDLFEGLAPNERLDVDRLARLSKAVQKQRLAIAIAATLKELPRGRSDIRLTPDVIGTLLPHAQDSRSVAVLLRLDSELLLHEGHFEDAADRVVGILHAGDALRGDPFLICTLIRYAVRTIAARQVERLLGVGQIKEETCRKLQEKLTAQRDENLLLAGIRGERAAIHILFVNVEQGVVPLADFFLMVNGHPLGDASKVLAHGGAMLYRSRLYEDHASFLRWLTRACKIAAMPWHEQATAWAKHDADLKRFVAESRNGLRNILTTMMVPAVNKVADSGLRDQALLSCAITALAAERFRLANGRWPKTLDELRPRLLAAVPTDAYDSKPLRYAVVEDGAVVYSVGKDGKDDGGDTTMDIGVRVWNVDRRGQPAK